MLTTMSVKLKLVANPNEETFNRLGTSVKVQGGEEIPAPSPYLASHLSHKRTTAKRAASPH